MAKVWVKLKDSGTIFHDASQTSQEAVTGKNIVRIERTKKAESAIRNSVLVEVPEKDVPADVKAQYEAGKTTPSVADLNQKLEDKKPARKTNTGGGKKANTKKDDPKGTSAASAATEEEEEANEENTGSEDDNKDGQK